MERDEALRELEALAEELARDGNTGLAERAREAIAALRNGSATHDASVRAARDEVGDDPSRHVDLLTLDDAAQLLGIRSLLMIRRWAREGPLDEVAVQGRVHITRGSIERLLQMEAVSRQRERERELDEIFEPFDIGDEELPPSDASSRGRAPWDSLGAPRS